MEDEFVSPKKLEKWVDARCSAREKKDLLVTRHRR